jgi:uncharacterized membrane protein YdjX (TVP38/TMEM64 family)
MERKIKKDIAIAVVILIILFTAVSFVVDRNIDPLKEFIQKNYVKGIFFFVLIEIIAIVFAPLTSVPLTPIASRTYGTLITFILIYIGTVIGSILAFFIAKRFGKKIVQKFISLEKAHEITGSLSEKNIFITLILLRILIPADILSYSLGIFTKIKNRLFITTTLWGTIPGAIFFAYLGTLTIFQQFIGWTIGIVGLMITFYLLMKIEGKNKEDSAVKKIKKIIRFY